MELKNIGGKMVWINANMVSTLETLETLRSGGFGVLKGYVSTSNRVKPEVADMNIISKISTENLYNRKIENLKGLTFADIRVKGEKLLSLSNEEQETLFASCKETMIASMEKTLSGDRSDAHRTAHDTFYAISSRGVKVHLKTEKIGKETVLILKEGNPIAESIMLTAIEMGRKVIEKGEYKVVNSGTKVLMDKCINNALNKKSVSLKTAKIHR